MRGCGVLSPPAPHASESAPLTLELPAEMLPKPSWVKISQIRTISVDYLGKRIAALDADALDQLIDGLLELTG